jgi:hypothetical protein
MATGIDGGANEFGALRILTAGDRSLLRSGAAGEAALWGGRPAVDRERSGASR